ncbi:MAG: hypothetical protein KBC64_05695 [Simkaniaceae bacterium]|nr:hypothetical protein [Simkaniaceae bacterium]
MNSISAYSAHTPFDFDSIRRGKLGLSEEELSNLPQENLNYYLENYSHFLALSRESNDHIALIKLDRETFLYIFTPPYSFRSPSGVSNSPNPYLRRMLSEGTMTIQEILSLSKADLEERCTSWQPLHHPFG